MRKSIFHTPVLHFDDVNGRPLVGGKLYTYMAGTNTPLNLYRSDNGDEMHTNPIILNGRGECTAFGYDDALYKFVLKDRDGTTIWERDRVRVSGEGVQKNNDVFDIVETFADLLEYDASGLGDGTRIKVLVDETHEDKGSYYKWDSVNESWVYIGSDESTYTRAEVDAMTTAPTDGKYGRTGQQWVKINETTVDSALSDTSTNPVENKVVKAALDGKENIIDVSLKATPFGDYTNIAIDFLEDVETGLKTIKFSSAYLLALYVRSYVQNFFIKAANLVASWGGSPSNSNVPSEKLVKDSLDEKIGEAPNDGRQYARKNKSWAVVKDEVIVAEYGVTTYSELLAAISASKACVFVDSAGCHPSNIAIYNGTTVRVDVYYDAHINQFKVTSEGWQAPAARPFAFLPGTTGVLQGMKNNEWTEIEDNVIDIVYEETPFATLKAAYDNGQSVRMSTTTSGVQVGTIFQPVYQQHDTSSDPIPDAVVFSNTYGNPNGQEQYAMNVLIVKKGDENNSDDWSLVAKQICNTFVAVLELTSAVAGNGPSANELRAAKTANKAIIVKVVEDSTTVYSAAIIEDDGTNLAVMFTSANQVFGWSVNGTRWTKQASFNLVEEADKDGVIYGRKNGAWVEIEGGSGDISNMYCARLTSGSGGIDIDALNQAYNDGKACFLLDVSTWHVSENGIYTFAMKTASGYYFDKIEAGKIRRIIVSNTGNAVWMGVIADNPVLGTSISSIPQHKGDIAITSDNRVYIAVGISSTSDWHELTGDSGASVGEVTYDTSTYAEVVAAFENNDFVKVRFGNVMILVVSHNVTGDVVNMLTVSGNGNMVLKVTSEDEWSVEGINVVMEAPDDGKQYARKDGDWAEVETEIPYTLDANVLTFEDALDLAKKGAPIKNGIRIYTPVYYQDSLLVRFINLEGVGYGLVRAIDYREGEEGFSEDNYTLSLFNENVSTNITSQDYSAIKLATDSFNYCENGFNGVADANGTITIKLDRLNGWAFENIVDVLGVEGLKRIRIVSNEYGDDEDDYVDEIEVTKVNFELFVPGYLYRVNIFGYSASVTEIERNDEFVEIGGRKYPVVTIGTQKWITENLDLTWSGLTVGGTSSVSDNNPHAWYYSNLEEVYGNDGRKCGLLYNVNALKYIVDNSSTLLPSGWSVASRNDYATLLNSGLANGSVYSLFKNRPWHATDSVGTNKTRFGAVQAGERTSGSAFNQIGVKTSFWTRTSSSSNPDARIFVQFNSGTRSDYSTDNVNNGFSIRLVKNAVSLGGNLDDEQVTEEPQP